ncbi:hypothetical protein D3C73_1383600 [compost metagenome]
MIGADQGQARHAVHVRQLQVQQQQVRRRRAQRGLRLGQAGAFDDLRAFGRLFDGRGQGRTKQGMVVGDDDAVHGRPSRARFLFIGRVATTPCRASTLVETRRMANGRNPPSHGMLRYRGSHQTDPGGP